MIKTSTKTAKKLPVMRPKASTELRELECACQG